MPGHEKRWCKYTIEYTDPVTKKAWKKDWAREVQHDPQINAFKQACQAIFNQAYPGQFTKAKGTFTDGFKNQPPMTKAI